MDTAQSSLRPAREPRDKPRSQGDRRSLYSTNSFSAIADLGSRASPFSSFPAFFSCLDYTSVRDFAYPHDSPYHYGIPVADTSGTTTPASEHYGVRRLSDPAEPYRNSSHLSAGQWGGDGVIFGDPDDDMEPLPSTSFGDAYGEDNTARRKGKHRKSKSYADISDFERGRRRESGGHRRSKDPDFYRYSSGQYDPAGRQGLRHSRGFAADAVHLDATGHRRDSHLARNAHHPPSAGFPPSADPDTRMPLDDEEINLHSSTTNPSFSHNLYQHHRASMHPEDESVRGQALALYDFEPENPNELRLREGQTVNVAYRNGHGWLVAEDPTSGEQGLVPEEYVRLVREIEGWDPERGGFIDEDAEDEADEEDGMDETEDEGQITPHEQDGGVRVEAGFPPARHERGSLVPDPDDASGPSRDATMAEAGDARSPQILSPPTMTASAASPTSSLPPATTAAKRSVDHVS
jgi:hypothetical protein